MATTGGDGWYAQLASQRKTPSKPSDGYKSPFTDKSRIYGGGLPSADMVAAWTNQRAGLQYSYKSSLAALAGQRKNIQSRFRLDQAAIEAQTVTQAVAAEGQAVERGVLGGSADVKNRIAVKAAGAAQLEAARMEKQQAIADTRQREIQARYELASGLATISTQEAVARSQATINEMANGNIEVMGALQKKDIVRNGVKGDIVEQIGRTQIGRAAYVFGSKNPGASFDCSGFTSWVYEQATGKTLAHNAQQQYMDLTDNRKKVITRNNLQPGDLLFFNFGRLAPGVADHVAIYLGNGMMMDASSSNNAIVTRAVPWNAGFLAGGRVSWNLLDKWYPTGTGFTPSPVALYGG